MQKKFWGLGAVALFLLAAGTAKAQSVDEKIKALEQELTQLKEQQVVEEGGHRRRGRAAVVRVSARQWPANRGSG